jgi:hypothetical protein
MPVSAQIITALRIRAEALDAEALDAEADRIEVVTSGASELPVTPQQPHARNVHSLRLMAGEFRALADQAEAR